MTVARVARPMAVRREHFGDKQTVRVVLVFHRDVVDVAGVHALAAFGESYALRPDPACPMAANSRPGADRDDAVGFGVSLPFTPDRQ